MGRFWWKGDNGELRPSARSLRPVSSLALRIYSSHFWHSVLKTSA